MKTCMYISHPDCGDPEPIGNGTVTKVANSTALRFQAEYTCNVDFELDGVSPRLCLDTGTYEGSAPTCLPVTLGVDGSFLFFSTLQMICCVLSVRIFLTDMLSL